MKISEQEVENIAHLARLKMDDEQRQALCGQLSDILGYMDKLAHVDVTGVAPASGAAFMHNVLREDVPQTSPGPRVTLANAPEKDQDYYLVPRVVK
ncbi:MAG: Asp-tRNA(Asn)/Glu-tRNA(Gln) amidotransferase subunit GatC [Desulfotignum sp.]|jgi:aspartyl-tRNA(Asn)/glutamyl-tRNA(Gln) amidotransferase subunit C|nr:Asp-tRNA(Asn)/Glu-tRNA(Gln) amidotransferase subunit GatC [Desulfotignum sp.]MCF8086603.1 Asp-tRNA(Asn)/Glu-tRNA(Gln) amidotransferase subunit GatC [Desulfotignum sp.]MCF8136209.1 Asp-tRNA(Asn)/Glu-tRNA(Gln) amidotransferase subunit GatC [Desulfotignum sp.]